MNPFDLKSALLARHAQHVVLIHFPIGLFIAAVLFDLLAQWTKRRGLADAAYYNLLVAAISTVPVIVTGILAWQFALEGQKVKGILLLHMVTAAVSTVVIWTTWFVQWRTRGDRTARPGFLIPLELFGVAVIGLTGHLGGFLSGVNAPG
jgi:uncharacterized membrane protein